MASDESSNNSALTQGWIRALIFIPAYIGVLILAQLLAFPLIYLLPDWEIGAIDGGMGGMLSLPALVISQGLVTLGGLALVWAFTTNFDKKAFSSLGIKVKGYVKDGGLGFVLGVALIAIGFFALQIGGYISVEAVAFAPFSLLGYGIFTLLVAFNEEVVVRGYVLRNFMGSMNKWLALVISALFFTLLHSFNPGIGLVPIINLFLAGLLLGIYYLYFRNLWFPIMLHLSWNYFQGSIFGFEVSGVSFSNSLITQKTSGPDWLTGGMFGFEGSVLLTLLMVLALAGLYGYFEKRKGAKDESCY